jgi:hypothetical protein
MGTYRINEETEKRLKEWAKHKYKDDAGRIAVGSFTFSDVISDLLKEAGF